jgi:hypothetical protein
MTDETAMTPPLNPLSMLVHVAFHHAPHRGQYLAAVLRAFAAYRLSRMLVVVDTNSSESKDIVSAIGLPQQIQARVDVHTDLPHPFDLTWMHRRHMASKLNEFDLFMYVEDDIEIPWPVFESWLRGAAAVERAGFVRGFLRVERDNGGRILSSDWRAAAVRPRFTRIDGIDYIRPEFFYQACWLCSATQVRQFIATAAWTQGRHGWSAVHRGHRGIDPATLKREFAAFGMVCSRPGRARVLLPVVDGQIARDAWIWHLPNNYAMGTHVDLLEAGALVQGGLGRRGLFSLAGLAAEGWRWLSYLLRLDVLRLRARRLLRRGTKR